MCNLQAKHARSICLTLREKKLCLRMLLNSKEIKANSGNVIANANQSLAKIY